MTDNNTTLNDLADDAQIYLTRNVTNSDRRVHTDPDCGYLHQRDTRVVEKRASMYPSDTPVCSVCTGTSRDPDSSREYYNAALDAEVSFDE